MLPDDMIRQLLAGFRSELDDYLTLVHRSLKTIEKSGCQAEVLHEAFRAVHNLKGAASAIGLESMAEVAHSLENVLSALRDGTHAADQSALELANQALHIIESLFEQDDPASATAYATLVSAWLDGQAGAPAAAPALVVAAAQDSAPVRLTASSVRIPLSKLDALLAQVHELLLARHRAERLSQEVAGLADDLRRLAQQERTGRTPSGALTRLEQLGERLERVAVTDEIRLGLSLGALQKQALELRMLPVQTLFDPLERQLDELARRTGKRVRLECLGGSVEVDRQVLEALKEPLNHLLRNAVDHGLEPPLERLAEGKAETGLVCIRASLEGNQLQLCVEDDGRGVDHEGLVRRARQLGLDLPEDPLRLLFRPGFSTRDQISETSGRGVGLDVVCLQVERLGGRLALATEPRVFTRFQLWVPIQLSTLRVVTFRCAGEAFALSTTQLVRAVFVDPEHIQVVAGQNTVLFEGSHLPAISLKSLLGLGAGGDERLALLVDAGQRLLLMADEIDQELEVVTQPLGPLLEPIPYYLGGTITGDNQVILVINPAGLAGGSAAPLAGTAPTQKQSFLLVVDDSITSRSLQKSILETAGFSVSLACDGLEALGMLRSRRFDLMISDIEMPGMDGLELTRTVKAAPDLKHVPVILVSSLNTPEDRENGAAAGADAYVSKGNFDQAHFVELVRSLL